MRLLIPLFALVTGCASAQTAYRAPIEPGPAGDEARACAAACIQSSQTSGHADTCLSQCPAGFRAYPGEACTRGKELPATLCVTVTTAMEPDMAFWSGVAEAAAESAVESATSNDDSKKRDESKARQSSSRNQNFHALAQARKASRERHD